MKKRFLIISMTCFSIALFTASFLFADFDPHQTLVRTPHIGTIRIELMRTVNPGENQAQQIEYRVTIDDQFDNAIGHRSGNLIPHLTIAQKDQLIAFMDMLWAKAETEILP